MLARSRKSKFCLSVCPSVCHMRALWPNQIMHCGYFDTTRTGNRSGFLAPTVIGGRRPIPSEICAQWPTPFQKRRLRHISAYNISTIRDGEKIQLWRIWNQSRAFQRAIDAWSAYVIPKSAKGWLKSDFCFFPITFSFDRIKSVTTFLCVKISSGIVVL